MMLSIIFSLFFIISGSFCQDVYDSVIETNYGQVGGVVKQTRNGGTYLSYAGIPFAKPPVGALRFANPVRPEPWTGILNGSVSSPRCAQRNYLFFLNPAIEGSEDCLYLNVYVPQGYDANAQYPVMVSIFWGAFAAGGGDEGFFDPSYYMDYGVIVVTFNYRVGIFGWLSTLDDAAPGNFGFKDQVLALQWVQENIESFGGIKEQVTIMGQSAGSASVHYHMLSPSSEGLFSQAISQSGVALALLGLPNNAQQKTVLPIQAQLVNCSSAVGNSTALVSCLRGVSVEVLLKSQDPLKSFYQFPYTSFGVVTETKSTKNPTPFITKSPLEYLRAGQFRKVPWIIGTVKNEGLILVQALLGPESERVALNNSFEALVPALLGVTSGAWKNLSQAYLGGKNFVSASTDEKWLQGFSDVFGERNLIAPTYQAVSEHLKQGHDSIYFYRFEYSGEQTFAGVWGNGSKPYNPNWSISHCDDLLYTFKIPELFTNQLANQNDSDLSYTLLDLWTNFATYGQPNPDNVSIDVSWEPLQLGNDHWTFLNITGSHKTGAHFKHSHGFLEKRQPIWKQNGFILNQTLDD